MVVDIAKPVQAPNSPIGGIPTIEPSFEFHFKTAKITRGDITATASANGTIEPAEVVDVWPRLAGG